MRKYILLFEQFAVAILSFYQTEEKLQTVSHQNFQLLKLFSQNPIICEMFANLTISKETKREYLQTIFNVQKFEINYQNGLKLFIDQGYSPFLYDLIQTIDVQVLALLKTQLVEVTSAFALDHDQKIKLEVKLQKKFKSKLVFQYYVVPNMILGISVRIDDYVEEYSVKSNLKILKDRFKQTKI